VVGDVRLLKKSCDVEEWKSEEVGVDADKVVKYSLVLVLFVFVYAGSWLDGVGHAKLDEEKLFCLCVWYTSNLIGLFLQFKLQSGGNF
jgi:hypothetical protein